MWIGIVVTGQAFAQNNQQNTKSHASAVALGLVPALAAWCIHYIQGMVLIFKLF